MKNESWPEIIKKKILKNKRYQIRVDSNKREEMHQRKTHLKIVLLCWRIVLADAECYKN